MSHPKFAAQLYTVRASCKTAEDLAHSLRKIRDIGYAGVQVSGIGPIPAEDVARAARDAGLEIMASHVPWQRFLDELDEVLRVHELWSCRHPAVPNLPAAYHTAEGVDRFVDELGPVAERLTRAGLDLAYHNHAREFMRFGTRTWLELLYDRASPEQLKGELDTYWVQVGGGDPVAWVRRLAGRMPVAHLKDLVVGPEGDQRYAEVGEGNLNWPLILHEAERGGVEWYAVEQDQCYERDPFDSLALSYANLVRMNQR